MALLSKSFLAAAGLIVFSETCLVLSGALIRLLTEDVSTAMLVFARSLLGLGLMLPWLLKRGPEAIKTQRLPLHLFRGAVGMAAMYCLYYAWGHLPLAQAALLKQTAPFFIPLIAYLWLHEKINAATGLALIVGFVGVYVVLNPGGGELQWAALVALAGAALGATAKVTVRKMADSEPSTRVVFYFSLFTAAFSLIPAVQSWQTPTLDTFILMVLMAVLSTLAQLLISKAYQFSGAAVLAPFTFSSVALAALLGWWFWDDILTYSVLIGVALIFSACLLNIFKGVKS